MRKKIVAGNWKMNLNFEDADELLFELKEEIGDKNLGDLEVVVCPPACYIELATDSALECDMHVGAQNISEFDNGAYTGEISAMMLESMEVEYCIIGHSERRKYFGETEDLLSRKVNKLLDYGIIPIYCCGEVLEEREKNVHLEVVKSQITKGLFHLEKDEFLNIVIAYEPVWAIGTGKTATPQQAQEMHHFIRNVIAEKFGKDIASQISILYGGSCNASNAKDLFSQPDIDGGLIGGASLKSKDFLAIINAMQTID
jgi:triosephosphate isomerase